MKKIFISHPYVGKKSNIEAIKHICKTLVPFGVMPLSPVLAFSFMKDQVPEERGRALEFCEELVELADEVWFFGEWQKSEGCQLEFRTALVEMIPIYEVVGWKGDKPLFKGEGPKWWKG